MRERLDLYERRNGDIYIAWTIDDEEGCELADSEGDAEHEAIRAAVRPFSSGLDGNKVFVFETKTAAVKVLRAARAAVKSVKAAKPWPEWAVSAAAHGWKAPKGWTP